MSTRSTVIIGLDVVAMLWCIVALIRQDGRGVLMAGGCVAAIWLFGRCFAPTP